MVTIKKKGRHGNFLPDSISSEYHGGLQQKPRSITLQKAKTKIHLCDHCKSEGWSDVDSEGYECYGLLHALRLNQRLDESASDMEDDDQEQENRRSKEQSKSSRHRSISQRVHVPKKVQNAIQTKSSNSNAYHRAMGVHNQSIKQGWSNKLSDEELQPTCNGAQRRVRMVQAIKREWWFGELICKILFISEKRVLNRPLLRGKIHLIASYLAPFWIYHYIVQDSKHPIGSMLSGLSIALCGIFSAILHHQSPRCISTYKRLRELDHCGIFFMCTLSPMAMVAHRGTELEYFLYGSIQFIFCSIGCISILKYNFMKTDTLTRVIVYITVGLSQLGAMGIILRKANQLEWICTLNFVWWILGGLCFGLRLPKLWPDIFSYHEVFHLSSMMSQYALLILIRSVITRS